MTLYILANQLRTVSTNADLARLGLSNQYQRWNVQVTVLSSRTNGSSDLSKENACLGSPTLSSLVHPIISSLRTDLEKNSPTFTVLPEVKYLRSSLLRTCE